MVAVSLQDPYLVVPVSLQDLNRRLTRLITLDQLISTDQTLLNSMESRVKGRSSEAQRYQTCDELTAIHSLP